MAEPTSSDKSKAGTQDKSKTNPLMHEVVPGDTLPEIAKHHYGNGDEYHWRKIYDANKQTIDQMQQKEETQRQQAQQQAQQQAPSASLPPSLTPGEKLTIPALTAEQDKEDK